MKKNIVIIILIFLIIAVSLAFFIREGVNLSKINRLEQSMSDKEADHEIEVVEMILTIDGIFKHYQKLLGDYREAAYETKQSGILSWSDFEITAYTSNECGTVTSTGLDLTKQYNKYLNVCAIDPEVVPYGSILLIEFANGEIKPYLAMDCGYEIKGNDIDIYMTDTGKAMEFGRQKLRVMVIN
jgi:3D (Asp-Asp-Asp) domain-containing protein